MLLFALLCLPLARGASVLGELAMINAALDQNESTCDREVSRMMFQRFGGVYQDNQLLFCTLYNPRVEREFMLRYTCCQYGLASREGYNTTLCTGPLDALDEFWATELLSFRYDVGLQISQMCSKYAAVGFIVTMNSLMERILDGNDVIVSDVMKLVWVVDDVMVKVDGASKYYDEWSSYAAGFRHTAPAAAAAALALALIIPYCCARCVGLRGITAATALAMGGLWLALSPPSAEAVDFAVKALGCGGALGAFALLLRLAQALSPRSATPAPTAIPPPATRTEGEPWVLPEATDEGCTVFEGVFTFDETDPDCVIEYQPCTSL